MPCGSRPDLAEAVTFLGCYSLNTKTQQGEGAPRVLAYLRESVYLGGEYQKEGDLQILDYCATGNGDDTGTCKSKEGYVLFSGEEAVSLTIGLVETLPSLSCARENLNMSVIGNEAIYLSKMQRRLDRRKTSIFIRGLVTIEFKLMWTRLMIC